MSKKNLSYMQKKKQAEEANKKAIVWVGIGVGVVVLILITIVVLNG